jgi:large subunit ribosomal protein L13
MVPKGPLGREQLKKLHIYNGEDQPHTSQKPELIDISVINKKNKRDYK